MNQLKELSARIEGLERRINLSSGVEKFGALKIESLIGKFTSEKVEHLLGSIKQEVSGEMAVQVILNVTSETQNEIDIEVFAGDLIIYRGKRNVVAGINEIFLMNTLSLAKGEEVDIKLFVTSATGTNYVKDASTFVWSSSAVELGSAKLSISADSYDNNFVICYLIDNKVYFLFQNEELSVVDFNDFNYYAEAKAVDCVLVKKGGSIEPYIFRLASDGNLYYSTDMNVQSESLCVASGVQNFSVSAFGERSGILVAYINNGFPYYKTIEGKSISLESEFPASKSKTYSAVCALKTSGSGTAVIVTTTKNANFIFELAPDLNFGSGDKIYCRANIVYL